MIQKRFMYETYNKYWNLGYQLTHWPLEDIVEILKV